MSLKNWVRKLFAPGATRPIARPTTLGVEQLGERIVPSAVVQRYDGGAQVTVGGSTHTNFLRVTADPNGGSTVGVYDVKYNGRDYVAVTTAATGGNLQGLMMATPRLYAKEGLTLIQVLGSEYADMVLVGTTVPTHAAGRGGDDYIRGGTGSDFLYGGDGNDQLYGQDGNDQIDGGTGNDTLLGDGGNDTLLGGTGRDKLDPGAGIDRLVGGADSDIYSIVLDVTAGYRVTTIVETAGQGDKDSIDFSDTPKPSLMPPPSKEAAFTWAGQMLSLGVTYDLSNAGPQQVKPGHYIQREGDPGAAFIEKLVGTEGADTLMGNDGNNEIYGLGGNDRISARGGNDTVYGGKGDDELHGGSGNDTIRGDEGDDYIGGGLGNDKLYGDQGDDDVFGHAGNDFIQGGSGGDLLVGGQGTDSLHGNDGCDYIFSADIDTKDSDHSQTHDEYEDGCRDYISGGGAGDYVYMSDNDDDDDGDYDAADFFFQLGKDFSASQEFDVTPDKPYEGKKEF